MVTEGRTGREGDNELLEKIEELEKQNAELAAKNVTLRAEAKTTSARFDALVAEVERLRGQVEEIDSARPGVTFNQLGSQIRQALSAIEDVDGGGASRYVARSAEFELKGAFDSENDELVLRLPGLTQRVDPGLLGSMRIELSGGDTGEIDVSNLVIVPTLLGMTVPGATNRLSAAGLAVGETSDQESVKPVGTVIAQDPPGGSYVSPDTAIDIVVASDEVTVPDLGGSDVARAARELAARGLALGDVATKESDAESGTILAQQPKAGSTVDRGTAVDVTVAEKPSVAVPNLVELTLDEASARLAASDLEVGPVTQQASEKPRGTVLAQQPSAGTRVAVGSRVALVTAGPLIRRALPVPDVVGRDRVAAVQGLAAGGFSAIVTAAPRRGGIVPGTFDTVASQVPAAGTLSADPAATIKVVAATEPVTAVRGIGRQAGTALRRARITTVGDLAFAAPEMVAETLGIAVERATGFVTAAGDLNDAASLEAIEEVDRAAALALVVGAGVRRPSQLAKQDSAALARTLQAARRRGAVADGITLDRRTVTTWVEAAKRYGAA